MKSSTLSTLRWIVLITVCIAGAIYLMLSVLMKWIIVLWEFNYPLHQASDIFMDKFQIEQIVGTQEDPHTYIRESIIDHMLVQWYSGRVIKPYENMTGSITSGETWTGFDVANIDSPDSLDQSISTYLDSRDSIKKQGEKPPFLLTYVTIENRKNINLFRNKKDLDSLWYTVVSYRNRTTRDPWYRRHNIYTALQKYWPVRVIVPGEKIDFLETVEYDPIKQENYMNWFTVVLDEEQEEYGGGLCGASTAIMQWVLTNSWLELTEQRNHSKRFTNLYASDINWVDVLTPWLDSTVYDGHIDLDITNTRDYPIILITEFDGEYGSDEIVFTLSKKDDLGSYNFTNSYKTTSSLFIDEKATTVKWACYHREVNGEDMKSCYKVVDKVQLVR